MTVTFSVPVPPSVNALFANSAKGGRIKTQAYRDWITEAGWMLKSQRPGSVTGPYAMVIRLPENIRGDIGNREKAISDLMVAHKITPDDRFCREILITVSPGIERACVTVRPWNGGLA